MWAVGRHGRRDWPPGLAAGIGCRDWGRDRHLADRFRKCGDPDRIRTCDPQIRNLMLYPAELRDQPVNWLLRHLAMLEACKGQFCPFRCGHLKASKLRSGPFGSSRNALFPGASITEAFDVSNAGRFVGIRRCPVRRWSGSWFRSRWWPRRHRAGRSWAGYGRNRGR